MNTAPARQLSASDAMTVEVATVFLSSIMAGYRAKNNSPTMRVDEGLQQAERHRNACVGAARNLMEANRLDHPEENADIRVRATASLMGATVSGLVARGEDPARALMEAARMRDRFFSTAKAVIERQIEMANRPPASEQAPFVGAPRDMNAWRKGREPLALEPMGERQEPARASRPTMG